MHKLIFIVLAAHAASIAAAQETRQADPTDPRAKVTGDRISLGIRGLSAFDRRQSGALARIQRGRNKGKHPRARRACPAAAGPAEAGREAACRRGARGSPMRAIVVLAALAIAGCATTGPDNGFGEVGHAVASRTGVETKWVRSNDDAKAVRERVKALLAKPLGCGTGTLSIWLKRMVPGASITGLDTDSKILALARGKAWREDAHIQFDQGLSSALPYADATFDKVVSSLFFHHLNTEQKRATLREVLRVLRPGGELFVADWGKPNAFLRIMFYTVQLLDGFESTRDSVEGRLPQIFLDAGFERVAAAGEVTTALGSIALHSAMKPHANSER